VKSQRKRSVVTESPRRKLTVVKHNKARSARAADPRLSEQQIIEAALRVTSNGVERLSMRKLAQELRVGTMSIYHYVKNKDELMERAADTIFALCPTPPVDGRVWKVQLRALARETVNQFAKHPGAARFMLDGRITPEARRLGRYTMDLLSAAGLDDLAAAHCFGLYQIFMFGVLSAQAQCQARGPSRAARPKTPVSRRTSGVVEEFNRLSFERWFEYSIDTLLDAFEQKNAPRPA
jgi:AcrR family transcriptional regulator